MKVKYDTIGKNYNVTRKADPLLADNLIKHLAPNQTGTYLDIGCGTGSYTHEFQKSGYYFIGIDPSKRMLAVANQRNGEVTWKMLALKW